MHTITVSAPGKIILMGEHAVVYGRPAIIASVDGRSYIKLTPRNDSVIEIISEDLRISSSLDEQKIIGITDKANTNWQEYRRTSNIVVLKSITKDPVDYIAIIIGEALFYLKKNLPSGFSLTINSEIPIGSGMGSSAAIAVSVAAEVSEFLGEKWNLERINAIAFLAEQKRHGNPSGGDTSASIYGGLISYRREGSDRKVIEPLGFSIPARVASNFMLVESGKPIESTGEMVSAVANLKKKRGKFVEEVFEAQERLTERLVKALKNGNGDEIISIIRKGEKNLEKIGVVSTQTKFLIRGIEGIGGGAKICGAGGAKKGSGMLLAYHKKIHELEEFLQSKKLNFFPVVLGAEGVRREL